MGPNSIWSCIRIFKSGLIACVQSPIIKFIYRTRANITRGLYIYYPILRPILCFQRGFFRKCCPYVWLVFKSWLWWREYGILRRPQNFAKSPPIIWLAIHRTNNWWRFREILWPSQNIWTLENRYTTALRISHLFRASAIWRVIWSRFSIS